MSAKKEKPGLEERLKAARKRRGLRQIDAAREIGISRGTLWRIECGYCASDPVRAKVRAWLEAEEEAAAAEAAAAERVRAAAERSAREARPSPEVAAARARILALRGRLALLLRIERGRRQTSETKRLGRRRLGGGTSSSPRRGERR